MTRVAISELEGVALAQAVADAAKVWEIAHEWFPTMTLDPTFIRAEIRNGICVLVPRNPMRQDPQVFDPATDWSQCGPLIERFDVTINLVIGSPRIEAVSRVGEASVGYGDDRKVAACRAIVAAHNPSGFVEVPEELIDA